MADRPLTLGGFLLDVAERHAANEALVFDDVRWTYADLEREARRVARSLLAVGVAKGSRVGILMANLIEYPVLRLRERLFPSDTRAARPEPTLAETPAAVAPAVVPEPVLASTVPQGSANA